MTPEDAAAAGLPLPALYQPSWAQNERLERCGVHHLCISNVVLLATASPIDSGHMLTHMQSTGAAARFPATGIRFSSATLLGFRTGKVVCTGATTPAKAVLGAINHTLLLLRQNGPGDLTCAFRHVRNMHITNIVISGKFFHFLDLKSQLVANAPNLRSSERFPGVYVEDEFLQSLRGGDTGCNFSLYPSGAFVCNSAHSIDDAISIV